MKKAIARLTVIALTIMLVAGWVAVVMLQATKSATATAPAPTVTNISPASGAASGGDSVTLTGSGFAGGISFEKIETGTNFSCGLTVSKDVYCWGQNSLGQLGDGTNTASTGTMVKVKSDGALSGKTIDQLELGASHACVLTTDGGVYCWGANTNRQLGDNTTTNKNQPSAVYTGGVLSGKTITSIGVGGTTSCALDSTGKPYCWGSDYYAQMGIGTTIFPAFNIFGGNHQMPQAVDTSGALNGKTVTHISPGTTSTCAIDSTGKAYCWGDNQYGQLGIGSGGTGSYSGSPAAVKVTGALSGKSLVQINSNVHTCAVDTLGDVFCWGLSSSGQTGDGTSYGTYESRGPATLPADAVEVNVGAWVSCATLANQKVYCWGSGQDGRLGDGTTSNRSTPASINMSGVLAGKLLIDSSISLATGCALDSDGKAYCWGSNPGSIGDGTTTTRLSPVESNMPSAQNYTFTVTIGGNPATITEHTATTLTFTTPPHAPGLVSIVITSPDTETRTLTNAFEYLMAEATPDMRLRHGKFFQNEIQQPIISE